MSFFEGTDLWTLAVIVGLTGVTILTRSYFFGHRSLIITGMYFCAGHFYGRHGRQVFQLFRGCRHFRRTCVTVCVIDADTDAVLTLPVCLPS